MRLAIGYATVNQVDAFISWSAIVSNPKLSQNFKFTGHVYVTKWNKCFPVYQRGPCRKAQYLIMPKNSRIPKCRLNSCASYGNVLFHKRCVKIGDPCGLKNEFKVYGVNETTLDFGCIKAAMPFESRFMDTYCRPGTKRHNKNLCPEQAK